MSILFDELGFLINHGEQRQSMYRCQERLVICGKQSGFVWPHSKSMWKSFLSPMNYRTSLSMDLACSQARPLAGFANFECRDHCSRGQLSQRLSHDCGPPPPLYSPLDIKSAPSVHCKGFQRIKNHVGSYHGDVDYQFIDCSPSSPRCVASPPPSAVRHPSLISPPRNLSPVQKCNQRPVSSSNCDEEMCIALDLSLKKPSCKLPDAEETPSENSNFRSDPPRAVCPTSPTIDLNSGPHMSRMSDSLKNSAIFAQTSLVPGRSRSIQTQLPRYAPVNIKSCSEAHDQPKDIFPRATPLRDSWSAAVTSEEICDDKDYSRDQCSDYGCEVSNNAQLALRASYDPVRCYSGFIHNEKSFRRASYSGKDESSSTNRNDYGSKDRLNSCVISDNDEKVVYGRRRSLLPDVERFCSTNRVEFEASVSWRVQPFWPNQGDKDEVRILSAHTIPVGRGQQYVSPHRASLPQIPVAEEGNESVEVLTHQIGLGGEDSCEESRNVCSAAKTKYKKYLANRYCKSLADFFSFFI